MLNGLSIVLDFDQPMSDYCAMERGKDQPDCSAAECAQYYPLPKANNPVKSDIELHGFQPLGGSWLRAMISFNVSRTSSQGPNNSIRPSLMTSSLSICLRTAGL